MVIQQYNGCNLLHPSSLMDYHTAPASSCHTGNGMGLFACQNGHLRKIIHSGLNHCILGTEFKFYEILQSYQIRIYTLTKIKLNEPGNSTLMGLHRKCLVKSAKHRQLGNYLFIGQGCLVECMADIKNFNKGNTGQKIDTVCYCHLLV